MTSLSSIIIVGGGAFGTSTAYHLAKRGYTNVKVLDRFEPPSKEAAATDLNKVIRYDYPNPLYAKLARKAIEVWKQEGTIFSGLFEQTGWIMAAQEMTKTFLQSSYETSTGMGSGEIAFMNVEETKRRFPGFTGSFPGWTNLWSSEAGWVISSSIFHGLFTNKSSRFRPAKLFCAWQLQQKRKAWNTSRDAEAGFES